MSELLENAEKRKEVLKHLILQLHRGEAPEQVRKRLISVLDRIPYREVVEVEQELMSEGVPQEEIQRLCDIHARVLHGQIEEPEGQEVPAGHPVDTFRGENAALRVTINELRRTFQAIGASGVQEGDAGSQPAEDLATLREQIHGGLQKLSDVGKHYSRKENLLFPYLERYGITGPPKVMWGKHDEVRDLLKTAVRAITSLPASPQVSELREAVKRSIIPAVDMLDEMITKEEEILFPMALDTLNEHEWWEIYQQTPEIGYCLYDPQDEWKPEGKEAAPAAAVSAGSEVRLPSGALRPEELRAILETLPVDLTFVDAEDKVRYFSQTKERVFDRTRAILGRDVRMCHPPSSVHVVEQILDDFRNGRQDRAPFWIQMGDRFILIQYFAVRSEEGEYLGTVEVTQDLTEARSLEGEQRILSYGEPGNDRTPD